MTDAFVKTQTTIYLKRPNSAEYGLCLNELDLKNVYVILPSNFHVRN